MTGLPPRMRLAFVGWCVWMCREWRDTGGISQRHWYRWNGDGPDTFDCSGFVLYGVTLFGAPNLSKTWNCDRMWKSNWARLELGQVEPGDLAFYGMPSHATHVMVWAGDGSVIGASGGGSNTTTPQVARIQNAFVKRKPVHNYRPDFLGFRRFEPLAALTRLQPPTPESV